MAKIDLITDFFIQTQPEKIRQLLIQYNINLNFIDLINISVQEKINILKKTLMHSMIKKTNSVCWI